MSEPNGLPEVAVEIAVQGFALMRSASALNEALAAGREIEGEALRLYWEGAKEAAAYVVQFEALAESGAAREALALAFTQAQSMVERVVELGWALTGTTPRRPPPASENIAAARAGDRFAAEYLLRVAVAYLEAGRAIPEPLAGFLADELRKLTGPESWPSEFNVRGSELRYSTASTILEDWVVAGLLHPDSEAEALHDLTRARLLSGSRDPKPQRGSGILALRRARGGQRSKRETTTRAIGVALMTAEATLRGASVEAAADSAAERLGVSRETARRWWFAAQKRRSVSESRFTDIDSRAITN